MSDAAVVTLVSGLVTVTTIVTGFLTLWIKIKYGVEKAQEAADTANVVEGKMNAVEGKVDENTLITERIEKQTNGPLTQKVAELERKFNGRVSQIEDHAIRVNALEVRIERVMLSIDSLSKNADSTRHEMRSLMQTMINNQALILAGMNGQKAVLHESHDQVQR